MPNFYKKTLDQVAFKNMRGRDDVSVEGRNTLVSVSSMSVSRAELPRFQPQQTVSYLDYLPNSVMKRMSK